MNVGKSQEISIFSLEKRSFAKPALLPCLVFKNFINLLWKVIMNHIYTVKSFFSTKTNLINWSSNSLLFSAQCWIFLHCIHNLPERFYCKKKTLVRSWEGGLCWRNLVLCDTYWSSQVEYYPAGRHLVNITHSQREKYKIYPASTIWRND